MSASRATTDETTGGGLASVPQVAFGDWFMLWCRSLEFLRDPADLLAAERTCRSARKYMRFHHVWYHAYQARWREDTAQQRSAVPWIPTGRTVVRSSTVARTMMTTTPHAMLINNSSSPARPSTAVVSDPMDPKCCYLRSLKDYDGRNFVAVRPMTEVLPQLVDIMQRPCHHHRHQAAGTPTASGAAAAASSLSTMPPVVGPSVAGPSVWDAGWDTSVRSYGDYARYIWRIPKEAVSNLPAPGAVPDGLGGVQSPRFRLPSSPAAEGGIPDSNGHRWVRLWLLPKPSPTHRVTLGVQVMTNQCAGFPLLIVVSVLEPNPVPVALQCPLEASGNAETTTTSSSAAPPSPCRDKQSATHVDPSTTSSLSPSPDGSNKVRPKKSWKYETSRYNGRYRTVQVEKLVIVDLAGGRWKDYGCFLHKWQQQRHQADILLSVEIQAMTPWFPKDGPVPPDFMGCMERWWREEQAVRGLPRGVKFDDVRRDSQMESRMESAANEDERVLVLGSAPPPAPVDAQHVDEMHWLPFNAAPPPSAVVSSLDRIDPYCVDHQATTTQAHPVRYRVPCPQLDRVVLAHRMAALKTAAANTNSSNEKNNDHGDVDHTHDDACRPYRYQYVNAADYYRILRYLALLPEALSTVDVSVHVKGKLIDLFSVFLWYTEFPLRTLSFWAVGPVLVQVLLRSADGGSQCPMRVPSSGKPSTSAITSSSGSEKATATTAFGEDALAAVRTTLSQCRWEAPIGEHNDIDALVYTERVGVLLVSLSNTLGDMSPLMLGMEAARAKGRVHIDTSNVPYFGVIEDIGRLTTYQFHRCERLTNTPELMQDPEYSKIVGFIRRTMISILTSFMGNTGYCAALLRGARDTVSVSSSTGGLPDDVKSSKPATSNRDPDDNHDDIRSSKDKYIVVMDAPQSTAASSSSSGVPNATLPEVTTKVKPYEAGGSGSDHSLLIEAILQANDDEIADWRVIQDGQRRMEDRIHAAEDAGLVTPPMVIGRRDQEYMEREWNHFVFISSASLILGSFLVRLPWLFRVACERSSNHLTTDDNNNRKPDELRAFPAAVIQRCRASMRVILREMQACAAGGDFPCVFDGYTSHDYVVFALPLLRSRDLDAVAFAAFMFSCGYLIPARPEVVFGVR